MGSHRYYRHAEIPHPHPGPPLEGEGDFPWLNNVANQVVAYALDARCQAGRRKPANSCCRPNRHPVAQPRP